ncbi:MAG: restriction endonuclease subunit S [Verrucomicrobia bacterium]|nr:restriction endonuclease subunit S [Verrucomicrobiota bacterium]
MGKDGRRKVKLKDVCNRITVGHVGPMADKYTDVGIPFLRSQNIMPFRLHLDDIKYIPADFHEKLRKSALRAGDVAVVRTGYPGTACVIPETFPELNCADLVVITPSSDLNPFYLAAIFNSAWGMASVAGNLVGVAQQHFNIGSAREMEISLPPLPTQRKIAAILSAYDDLIANSDRRIKILEEMAQNLYREWFVKFRFPGHEKVKIVDSPLGKIPQGWEVKKFGEMADVRWGDTATTKASYVSEGFDAYSATGLDGKLDHYDFDRTGVVLSAIGANCGRTWYVNGKWSCIKNTIRFWSTSAAVSDVYLYFVSRDSAFWPKRGAAQPFISQTDALNCLVLVSSDWQMTKFTAFARDVLKQKGGLERRNRNLRQTRDLLLPKLISGEIDVSGLDIEIPESAA